MASMASSHCRRPGVVGVQYRATVHATVTLMASHGKGFACLRLHIVIGRTFQLAPNADTAGRAPFNRLPCIGAELGRKKESFPSRGHVWDQGLYVGFGDGTAGMDVLPPWTHSIVVRSKPPTMTYPP